MATLIIKLNPPLIKSLIIDSIGIELQPILPTIIELQLTDYCSYRK